MASLASFNSAGTPPHPRKNSSERRAPRKQLTEPEARSSRIVLSLARLLQCGEVRSQRCRQPIGSFPKVVHGVDEIVFRIRGAKLASVEKAHAPIGLIPKECPPFPPEARQHRVIFDPSVESSRCDGFKQHRCNSLRPQFMKKPKEQTLRIWRQPLRLQIPCLEIRAIEKNPRVSVLGEIVLTYADLSLDFVVADRPVLAPGGCRQFRRLGFEVQHRRGRPAHGKPAIEI